MLLVQRKQMNEKKKKLNGLETQMHVEPVHLPSATAPAAATNNEAARRSPWKPQINSINILLIFSEFFSTSP